MTKISKNEYEKIIDLYKSGITEGKIAEQYSVHINTISNIVRKFNIARPDDKRPHSRKYSLNEHYFDDIDTPNKAYIIGFLWADGSNNLKNHVIELSLQERDKDILIDISNELGSNRPLRFYNLKSKNPNYSNQYRLSLSSKYMSDLLNSLGMVQNKSLYLKFPTWLREDLYPHFIRGYLDGDGWISKNLKAPRVEIVGTNSFCEGLSEYIYQRLEIQCAIRKRYKNSKSPVRQLDFGGRRQVKCFLDFIYKDADLYLDRKFNIYKSIFYSHNIDDSLSA